ncbi:hypothetical protein BSM4216_3762 [Bacillus smithii]|nr:hypothetical protein BSM4216_3762 [Bacillus smithii]
MKSLNFVVKQKKISQKRILDTLMLDAFLKKGFPFDIARGSYKRKWKKFSLFF